MSKLPEVIFARDKVEIEESERAGQKAFNAARRLLWGISATSESVPIYDPGGDDFRIIHPRYRYLDLGEDGELTLSDTDQSRDVSRVSEEHVSVELRGMDERSEWSRKAGIKPEGELVFCIDVSGHIIGGYTNIIDGQKALEVIEKFGNPNLVIPLE